jgi:hypothetical protein
MSDWQRSFSASATMMQSSNYCASAQQACEQRRRELELEMDHAPNIALGGDITR